MQPMQSVNCHDSCAHNHKRQGPFTQLVGLDMSGLSLVSLVHGMQQVRNLCAWFDYRWDACEHWSVLALGVTHVSLRHLITVGNLGAWSYLAII
jgi:hypothetical protein